jgi:hypothetical protein
MVSHPQIKGGNIATNGGTHQTGSVNMINAKQMKADQMV